MLNWYRDGTILSPVSLSVIVAAQWTIVSVLCTGERGIPGTWSTKSSRRECMFLQKILDLTRPRDVTLSLSHPLTQLQMVYLQLMKSPCCLLGITRYTIMKTVQTGPCTVSSYSVSFLYMYMHVHVNVHIQCTCIHIHIFFYKIIYTGNFSYLIVYVNNYTIFKGGD